MSESISTSAGLESLRHQTRALNPSASEWRLHGVLFFVTVLTTVLAGIMLAAPEIPDSQPPPLAGLLDYILYVPIAYLHATSGLISYGIHHPALIADGATFASSLLAI